MPKSLGSLSIDVLILAKQCLYADEIRDFDLDLDWQIVARAVNDISIKPLGISKLKIKLSTLNNHIE